MNHPARSFRSRNLSGLAGAAVLALAAVVLSGCEVTEASGNNYNSGPVCPMIYEPVCAERRGEARTFPNSCEARAQDWRVVASGQCRSGNVRDGRDGRDRDFRGRDRDRDVRRDDRNRDYRGRDDRPRDDRRNFRDTTNQPDFERPRFDNRPGRNAPVRQPVRPEPPVYQPPLQPGQPIQPIQPVRPVVPGGACPQVSQQVCGQLGENTRMFMNRCELQRAGANEVGAGLCMGGNR